MTTFTITKSGFYHVLCTNPIEFTMPNGKQVKTPLIIWADKDDKLTVGQVPENERFSISYLGGEGDF